MSINMEKSEGASALATSIGVAYTVPRVNLLPSEVTAARAFRRTQVGLGASVLVVLGALGAVFVLSQQQADDAAAELAAEQGRTTTLQAEQAQYAEVPQVLAQVDAAQSARATAMGSDVLWYRYLNDLALTYPANVWVGDLTATVTPPVAGAVVAPGTTNPLTTAGIGTVAFTGTGMSNPDIANWLDVLAGTSGFADASLGSATRTERGGQDVVDFTTQVTLTDEALSHRYDGEAS